MNEFEVIKHIMLLQSVSYDDLSRRLGYKCKSTSYRTLSNKHIWVDTWRKYLGELGYEVVVRKKNDESESYVVTDDGLPSPLHYDMSLDFDKILSEE